MPVLTQTIRTVDEWKQDLAAVPVCHFPVLDDGNTRISSHGKKKLPVIFDRSESILTVCSDNGVFGVLQAAWSLVLRYYLANDAVSFVFQNIEEISPSDHVVIDTMVCHMDLGADATLSQIAENVSKGEVRCSAGGAEFHQAAKEFCNTSVSVMSAKQDADLFESYGIDLVACCSSESSLNMLNMELVFDNSFLSVAQARNIAAALSTILGQFTTKEATSGDFHLIAKYHEDQIFRWNQSLPPITEELVHRRFTQQALTQPRKTAILSWDDELTYQDLDELSSRLGRHLHALGVGPEVLVPFCFEKSAYAIVAMLGILKSGGAFVPLDPDHPTDRLADILEQTRARVVLSSPLNAPLFPSTSTVIVSRVSVMQMPLHSEGGATSSDGASPTNTAYVYFTSGTTGRPKGVVMEHGPFNVMVSGASARLGIGAHSRMLQFTSYTFDACLIEIFGPLCYGGCVYVPAQENRTPAIAQLITEAKVNAAFFTPTFLRLLRAEDVPTLERLLIGGEALTKQCVEDWAGKVHAVNGYGPTECCVISAAYDISSVTASPANIGRALNCACWIADKDNSNRLVPIGAVGELLIQGPTLFRGYLNNPELTAAAVVNNPPWLPVGTPESCRRLYKTGDLVRYASDGSITYIGRKDSQVKVRGQRVELTAIDRTILLDPSVKNVVVVLPCEGPWKGRLVAVLSFSVRHSSGTHDEIRPVLEEASKQKVIQIQKSIARTLPQYMVPESWIVVEQIPMTASGKIGRKDVQHWLESVDEETYRSLAGIEPETMESGTTTLSSMEQAIQELCASTLNLDPRQVGVRRSFVNLGGDSITAMQFMSGCRAKGIRVTIRDILHSENIRHLACLAKRTSGYVQSHEETLDTPFGLLLIQQMHFRFTQGNENSFSQSFLLKLRSNIPIPKMIRAIEAVIQRHSMLRARFARLEDGQWIQYITSDVAGSYEFHVYNCISRERMGTLTTSQSTTLDIENGPLLVATVCRTPHDGLFLTILIHHLVVDLVSWRIIIQDLEDFLRKDTIDKPKPFPFQAWCQKMVERDQTRSGLKEDPRNICQPNWEYWGLSPKMNIYGDVAAETFRLTSPTTTQLLIECPQALSAEPTDILLGTLVHSFNIIFHDRGSPTVLNESHGRNSHDTDEDLTQTVGWFTTMYPLCVTSPLLNSPVETIRRVKDQRRDAKNQPATLANTSTENGSFNGEVLFNYMGKYQQLERNDSLFSLEAESGLDLGSPTTMRPALFEISVSIRNSQAEFTLAYNRKTRHPERIQKWAAAWELLLEQTVQSICRSSIQYTCSDLPLLHFDQNGVEGLMQGLKDIGICSPGELETVCPTSPIQQSMLMSQKRSSVYYTPRILIKLDSLEGPIDAERLRNAWRQTIARHAILRTIFLEVDNKHAQIVLRRFQPQIQTLGFSCDEDPGCTLLNRYPSLEKYQPPHRLTLCSRQNDVFAIYLEIGHTIMDYYSIPTLLQDLASAYDGQSSLPPPIPYSKLISYIHDELPASSALAYWKQYMNGCISTPVQILKREEESDLRRTQPLYAQRVVDPVQGLLSLPTRVGVTLPTVFRLAWAILLHIYTGFDDIGFTYVVSGRDVPLSDIQEIAGPFLNLLPCRMTLSPLTTIAHAMRQLQEDFVEGLKYQHAASRLVHGKFNTLLNYRKYAAGSVSYGTASIKLSVEREIDPFDYDLCVEVDDTDSDIITTFTYWKERAAEDVTRLSADFLRVLDILQKSQTETTRYDILRAFNKEVESEGK